MNLEQDSLHSKAQKSVQSVLHYPKEHDENSKDINLIIDWNNYRFFYLICYRSLNSKRYEGVL